MSISILSTTSRKAWVGGATSALLTPILEALLGTDVLTLRALLVALASGVVGAVAVWATSNESVATQASDGSAPATASHIAQEVAADVLAVTHVVATDTALMHTIPAVPEVLDVVDHLAEEAQKDFGGQSVQG